MLPTSNILLQIPSEWILPYLQCCVYIGCCFIDFKVPLSVLKGMLNLNVNESSSYLKVIVFGSWRRPWACFLGLYFCKCTLMETSCKAPLKSYYLWSNYVFSVFPSLRIPDSRFQLKLIFLRIERFKMYTIADHPAFPLNRRSLVSRQK